MKVYLDTADTARIREMDELGVVDGVTTNPSIVADAGSGYRDVVTAITECFDGPVFAQVIADDVDTVDTTGAGDTFLAGFIASLTNGVRDAERALALANAVGAVATTQPGAVSALVGAEQLRAFHVDVPWVEQP